MQPNPMDVGPKGKPWPTYFIVRTTGEIVPMIAVDELPPNINLLNIPRELELEATIGMLNLGLQRSNGAFYRIVEIEKDGRDLKEATPIHPRLNSNSKPIPPHPSAPASIASSSSLPSTTPKLSPTKARQNPNSAFANSQTCRHWCTHGICKWGQQCRYKHIMPMTIHGLQEAGLRDWPRWYRALNPGYFVENGRSLENGREMKREKGVRGGNAGKGIAAEQKARTERVRDRLRELGSGVERVAKGAKMPIAGGAKSEELGERILERLRGLERENGKERAEDRAKLEKGSENGNRSTGEIERSATKDARRWEDDESDEEEEVGFKEKVEKKAVDAGKGKLVDV